MKNQKKLRNIIKLLIKETLEISFDKRSDTEMLDYLSNDNIAFISLNTDIYNWFLTGRIQLIGNQLWVKSNDFEVKKLLRKVIDIQKH